ncbi:cyclic nucleotide-binding domain-containing protein [Spirillospora albida]|uniref:cyclic nucleotide-binding domain-containing protein n=1 Tax=Spirillospora albida TaxID=58123 RepID=UPI0004C225C4|nr:cyclic nucleotide-binding domain-containing protein [Spirillospora albida]
MAHRHDPDLIGPAAAPPPRPAPDTADRHEFAAARPAAHSPAGRPSSGHPHPEAPAGGPPPGGGHAAKTRHGFLGSLTPIERAALEHAAHESVYPLGTVLWREGETADHVLILRSGWVTVCVEREGHERILATRGPGDIIGERAALMLRQRSASIVALDTVRALRLTTQEFAAYLSDHPRVLAVIEREVYLRMTENGAATAPPPAAGMTQPPAAFPQHYAYPQPYAFPQHYAGGSPPWTNPYAALQHHIPVMDASWPYGAPLHRPVATHPVQWASHALETQTMAAQANLHPAPSWSGQNCTIVFADIAGYNGRHRDDDDRRMVKHAMYDLLRAAFEESKVPWDATHHEDRGDGVMLIVPPEMPTMSVVDPMLAWLAARLRRYNHQAGPAVRLQLRLAVHVGPVTPDAEGVSGSAVNHTARLVEAPVLKRRLTDTGADLGFIASPFVYDSVIAHSPGYVNAADYEHVTCTVKESEFTGWMFLPTGPGHHRAA